MPPKLVVEKLPGQCDGIIAANPFLGPTKKFLAEFSEQDKKRLTDEITKAVNDDVLPAYRKFAEFLRTDTKDRFRALRSELEPSERALLVMRVDRDMSWDEIAHVLAAEGDAAKPAALRKRFERIKQVLRESASEAGWLEK